jgi:hypothetical protein
MQPPGVPHARSSDIDKCTRPDAGLDHHGAPGKMSAIATIWPGVLGIDDRGALAAST